MRSVYNKFQRKNWIYTLKFGYFQFLQGMAWSWQHVGYKITMFSESRQNVLWIDRSGL